MDTAKKQSKPKLAKTKSLLVKCVGPQLAPRLKPYTLRHATLLNLRGMITQSLCLEPRSCLVCCVSIRVRV